MTIMYTIAQICILMYCAVTNSGKDMGKAITVKEVAEHLNVNERTVYRLAQAGKLPGFKVAGSWRFLEEDLEAWIERQKKQVAADSTAEDSKGNPIR